MLIRYRHTQIGYLVIAILGIMVVGFGVVALTSGPRVLLVTVAILVLCLLLFPTLTAMVEENRVICFFGFGLIRRTVPLSEVLSVSVVRNSWLYGWGLRIIPGGSLWNVSGLDAVELRLANGRRFRIGTDEPNALYEAISAARAAGQG
jgi:hypothetical protein